MNYQELIEWGQKHCGHDSFSVECCNHCSGTDAIESILAENERLKHNLVVTEQTMREYQELAAKRLEEIERLKEIEQTNDMLLDQLGDATTVLLDQVADLKEENRIERNLRVGVEHGFDCANEQIGLLRLLIDEQKAELAKYRDAPVVAWKIAFKAANTPDGFLTIHYHGTNAITDYRQIDPNATVEQLIVKPGE